MWFNCVHKVQFHIESTNQYLPLCMLHEVLDQILRAAHNQDIQTDDTLQRKKQRPCSGMVYVHLSPQREGSLPGMTPTRHKA